MAETASQIADIQQHLQSGQLLMVGHLFVHHPQMHEIHNLISQGQIGQLKHITSRRLNWGIYQTKTDPLLSLAVHDISILLQVCSTPVITQAQAWNYSSGPQLDRVCFNGYDGEVTFDIDVSWHWPVRTRQTVFIGSQGQIVWDQDANTVTVITTALNWSLAASAAAANTALTLGVGAAAIAAGLVVAAGAFLVYKNATKSATEETGKFKDVAGPVFGPELTNVTEKVVKTGGAVDDMAAKIKKASDALKSYMVTALKDAQSALEDAQGAFNDFATSVSDGLKDAFSFKDAKDAGDETGKGFLDGLRAQVKGIQTLSLIHI